MTRMANRAQTGRASAGRDQTGRLESGRRAHRTSDRRPDRRPDRRGDTDFGAYVAGANALDLDYAPPPTRSSPMVEVITGGAARTSDMATPPAPMVLPRAPFVLLVVAVVVAGVLGVLVINTKINENAFRLDDLRAHQAALDLQEQQLTQELAERESPGNLAAAAKRLGLVPAGTPAFISLPDGRVVGVPQPAPADATTTRPAEPGR